MTWKIILSYWASKVSKYGSSQLVRMCVPKAPNERAGVQAHLRGILRRDRNKTTIHRRLPAFV